ncbi:hypothetical protein ACEPPN_015984 [Leptodophora sp. 'Broadleaf-Isolate-01']
MSNQPPHHTNQPSGPPPAYSPIGIICQEQTEIDIQVEQSTWKQNQATPVRPESLPSSVWIAVPPNDTTFTIPQLFALNPHLTNTRIIRFEVAVGKRMGYVTCLTPDSLGDVDLRLYRMTFLNRETVMQNPCWDRQRGVYHLQHFIMYRGRGEWA